MISVVEVEEGDDEDSELHDHFRWFAVVHGLEGMEACRSISDFCQAVGRMVGCWRAFYPFLSLSIPSFPLCPLLFSLAYPVLFCSTLLREWVG